MQEESMFQYDYGQTEFFNFTQWRYANESEREVWGQAKLDDEEAQILFKQLKVSGWLKKQSQNQSADDHGRIDHN